MTRFAVNYSENVLQDLRLAARYVVQRPVFAAIVVLTLAVGIGANSAVVSVVNGVLLQPLPFKTPNQLVVIKETLPDEASDPLAYRTYAEFRDRNRLLDSIAATASWNFNVQFGGSAARLPGMRVTASYFPVMGLKPLLGRGFDPDVQQPGAERVAIIDSDLWQRYFGGTPDVLTRRITLDFLSYRIVGVMPALPELKDTGWAGLWVPLYKDDQKERLNPGRYLNVIGRLKPNASVEQSQAELARIMSLLRRDFPETHGKQYGVLVRKLEDFVVPDRTRTALLILLGVVGFVLLIACSNVANLMLARGASRQREIAVRAALGASRGRLVGQLLTEALLLSAIAAALGLLLADAGVAFLVALKPDGVPRLDSVRISGSVLAFTLGVSIVTALVFGLAPALAATSIDLNETLKEGGRAVDGELHNRFRGGLVAGEIALTLILLAAAGLMVESMLRLNRMKLGFNPERVLTVEFSLPGSVYWDAPSRVNFYRQLVDRASTIPGVQFASAAQAVPLRGPTYTDPVYIDGEPPPAPGQEPFIRENIVTPDFFRAIEMRLASGRVFTEQESWETGGAIIVNQAFVRRFFPNRDPLEGRIRFGPDKPWLSVVGVVVDTVQSRFDMAVIPEMFYPYMNPSDPLPVSTMTLVIRSSRSPETLVDNVRAIAHNIDSGVPPSRIATMRQIVDRATATPRFNSILLSLFSGLALILAAVGVYGVMSYTVSRRTREIGIRVALGARPSEVFRFVIGRGLTLTLIGIGLGLAGAIVPSRLMSSMLYGAKGLDPSALAVVTLLLSAISMLACYLPARRATRVDPAVALRCD